MIAVDVLAGIGAACVLSFILVAAYVTAVLLRASRPAHLPQSDSPRTASVPPRAVKREDESAPTRQVHR